MQPGVEVKLIDHPDRQGQERYVLCRSKARYEKEAAMLQRQRDRLRDKLEQIDASLKKRVIEEDLLVYFGDDVAAWERQPDGSHSRTGGDRDPQQEILRRTRDGLTG